jgi:hypothetical protein
MDDETIQARIARLVEREHELRQKLVEHSGSQEAETAELTAAEEELDQCWDLLRQRRAKREFGENADEAKARSVPTVEHYLQ